VVTSSVHYQHGLNAVNIHDMFLFVHLQYLVFTSLGSVLLYLKGSSTSHPVSPVFRVRKALKGKRFILCTCHPSFSPFNSRAAARVLCSNIDNDVFPSACIVSLDFVVCLRHFVTRGVDVDGIGQVGLGDPHDQRRHVSPLWLSSGRCSCGWNLVSPPLSICRHRISFGHSSFITHYHRWLHDFEGILATRCDTGTGDSTCLMTRTRTVRKEKEKTPTRVRASLIIIWNRRLFLFVRFPPKSKWLRCWQSLVVGIFLVRVRTCPNGAAVSRFRSFAPPHLRQQHGRWWWRRPRRRRRRKVWVRHLQWEGFEPGVCAFVDLFSFLHDMTVSYHDMTCMWVGRRASQLFEYELVVSQFVVVHVFLYMFLSAATRGFLPQGPLLNVVCCTSWWWLMVMVVVILMGIRC